MNSTQQLHQLGQRLWLDNITRTMLADGTLARYIRELAVTGLTSNPAIFEQAIKQSNAYDAAIRARWPTASGAEEVFFDLALQDLRQAATLFRPLHDTSDGTDGWVSLEVSPLLARDTAGTVASARQLHGRAKSPNLFIKIPGSAEGTQAIEDTIFGGIPVNVTLLFSRAHYVAAAEAYVRGLERRAAAGLDLDVASVASMFVSRWDAAVSAKVPPDLNNKLGVAIAASTWHAHQALLASPRWQALAAAGARPQRLLWASTGTKDPAISATYYVEALALAGTINTLPEKTLLAFASEGKARATRLPSEADNAALLGRFRQEGIDTDALAADLQHAGIEAFAKSWASLMACIVAKR